MSADETYRIHAIKYAHHGDRKASANFIGGDPHDAAAPLDYFVWAIQGGGRTFVLDTGFDGRVAAKRNRSIIRSPGDGLKALGIDPDTVGDVIMSHMHFDHAGNHDLFPRARYHLQDREMHYCTGRCMAHPFLNHTFEVDDVVAMVRRVFVGRVLFHDGTAELAPGLTLHHVGGHSSGLQVARVRTRRGWVVLASDASHLYANMEQGRPFPIVANVVEMLEGYRTLRALASSPQHIIPGHDPLVLARYPASAPGLEGIAARLDADPTG